MTGDPDTTRQHHKLQHAISIMSTWNCIVLMYHVIDKPLSSLEARLCCPPERFAEQMSYLRSHGYSVIPLARLAHCLTSEAELPKRAVVITFDDGSSCTYERALPILDEYRYPATVFVVAGLVGKFNEWLQSSGFPKRRILNARELDLLASAGFDVGSHTLTHPWLGRIARKQAHEEIAHSKAQLEDMLGRSISHFAYPYGDFTPDLRQLVAETGYSAACSTRWGKSHTRSDLFDLRRVEVTGQDSLVQFALKLRSGTHNMPPVPEARQVVRRGLERIGILRQRRH